MNTFKPLYKEIASFILAYTLFCTLDYFTYGRVNFEGNFRLLLTITIILRLIQYLLNKIPQN